MVFKDGELVEIIARPLHAWSTTTGWSDRDKADMARQGKRQQTNVLFSLE